MTVAAVIIVPDPARAVAPIEGQPVVARLLDVAWAGGATPVVLVTGDPEGILAEAVPAGAATLVGSSEPPSVGWFAAGMADAVSRVSETSAALLWPFRYAWVDPETITSLIEAHGRAPRSLIRPAYAGEPGFPVLVPVEHGERLSAEQGVHAPEAVDTLVAEGTPLEILEVGDPGTVRDLGVARADLPAYDGPPEPAGGPPPEWNAELGLRAADPREASDAVLASPLEGGAAPFDQAEREV